MTQLTKVINARGTYTPLGVSRASANVCDAVSEALSDFFIIDELQTMASQRIAGYTGGEAATITHCSAASITVCVAAAMAGTVPEHVGALPDTTGMADQVVIPEGHCVNYGQPILQAIRLAGAKPILAGSRHGCSLEDIEQQIDPGKTCCLLLVSSKLVQASPTDLGDAVAVARKFNIPTIIDGAAQDFRIGELLDTGADLILISAQKYLASPTAGIVLGKRAFVDAVRAQEKGIGRGMKASKEAIFGVLAAMEDRSRLDLVAWQQTEDDKVNAFIQRAGMITGLSAHREVDPTGLPFSRAYLTIDKARAGCDTPALVDQLRSGTPSIWTIDDRAADGVIGFELVQCTNCEIEVILNSLSQILQGRNL